MTAPSQPRMARAKTREDKKREMMRRAKTAVESSHGLGGLPKEKGHKPKPITLPKMPWDKGNSDVG